MGGADIGDALYFAFDERHGDENKEGGWRSFCDSGRGSGVIFCQCN